MRNEDIISKIKGQLIVSCQALPDEPLYSSYIMSRMAYAAVEGGAAGIRANTVQDIREIKKVVNVPIIGIIKKVYPGVGKNVYITPTMEEIDQLAACNVEIIAMDATKRSRPFQQNLKDVFMEARRKYPNQLFMADCSNLEEGLYAAELGFDLIGTTLAGYTEYTKGQQLPDFKLLRSLVKEGLNVIAEGGIWTPQQLKEALETGALAAVVGTAITRPREITKNFVNAIS